MILAARFQQALMFSQHQDLKRLEAWLVERAKVADQPTLDGLEWELLGEVRDIVTWPPAEP